MVCFINEIGSVGCGLVVKVVESKKERLVNECHLVSKVFAVPLPWYVLRRNNAQLRSALLPYVAFFPSTS